MRTVAGAPSVKWLVDISDPYSGLKAAPPYNRLFYGWLSLHIERKVIAGADAISVTTESTAQLYRNQFSISKNKVRVIPPLMSLPKTPQRTRYNDDNLQLVFIGTLYRTLRSPRFLLACFSELKAAYPQKKLELHFYGSVNDCGEELQTYSEMMRESVFIHGLVPRSVVHQAMANADVLVNIGNDSDAQLASKVVEYMAVGKPILNIVSIAKDTASEALSDYPAVLNLQRSDGSPSQKIIDELAGFLFALPTVPIQYTDSVRKRYGPELISLQYAEMLEPDDVPLAVNDLSLQ